MLGSVFCCLSPQNAEHLCNPPCCVSGALMSGLGWIARVRNIPRTRRCRCPVSVWRTLLRLTFWPILIPTLSVPAEHQHSSGIVRHYDAQNVFVFASWISNRLWICFSTGLRCSKNHWWSPFASGIHVNVPYTTRLPKMGACNLASDPKSYGELLFLQQRTCLSKSVERWCQVTAERLVQEADVVQYKKQPNRV